MALPSIEELEQEVIPARQKNAEELEKQVRITLASSSERAIPLEWNGGKIGDQNRPITRKLLAPGDSVVRPIWQGRAWFGPFDVYLEFTKTPREDVARRSYLKGVYRAEVDRVLNRYGWEYDNHRSMHKIGHNRMPDMIVQVLHDDGSPDGPQIRLHELYKIGNWDPEKENFGQLETAEQARLRADTAIAEAKHEHERELAAVNARIAHVTGLVEGMAISQMGEEKADAPSAAESKEAVPA